MLKAFHNYLIKLKFNHTLSNGKGICDSGYKNLTNVCLILTSARISHVSYIVKVI